MHTVKLTMGALLGLGMLACGGAAVPHQQVASTEAAIRAAEVGGAPNVPKAELHLKYAREQLAEAKKLIEDGDNERAGQVLRRAEVDAELALALADEHKAQAEAQEVLKRIQRMMEQS